MVRITQATEQDFLSVRRLFSEYVEWIIPLIEEDWRYTVPVTATEVVDRDMAAIEKFLPPNGRLFLASDDRNVIGCACAWTIRPGLAEIKRVYVRPSGRGSGIGRALVQTVITDFRDAGYTAIWLETGMVMTAAQKLYRSLGFQDIPPYDESEAPKEFHHRSIFLELSL